MSKKKSQQVEFGLKYLLGFKLCEHCVGDLVLFKRNFEKVCERTNGNG